MLDILLLFLEKKYNVLKSSLVMTSCFVLAAGRNGDHLRDAPTGRFAGRKPRHREAVDSHRAHAPYGVTSGAICISPTCPLALNRFDSISNSTGFVVRLTPSSTDK